MFCFAPTSTTTARIAAHHVHGVASRTQLTGAIDGQANDCWPSIAQTSMDCSIAGKQHHSAAQRSAAQRSTAQRSAAQHSTAQHSTAQHSMIADLERNN